MVMLFHSSDDKNHLNIQFKCTNFNWQRKHSELFKNKKKTKRRKTNAFKWKRIQFNNIKIWCCIVNRILFKMYAYLPLTNDIKAMSRQSFLCTIAAVINTICAWKSVDQTTNHWPSCYSIYITYIYIHIYLPFSYIAFYMFAGCVTHKFSELFTEITEQFCKCLLLQWELCAFDPALQNFSNKKPFKIE